MKRILTICALFGLASTAVYADNLGVNFTGYSSSNTGTQSSTDGFTAGYEFTANSALSVTALGAFDNGSSAGGGMVQVGLWNSSGVLLASAYVSSADPLTDSFWRFASISPVSLVAGDTYYVASQGSWDYTYFTTGFSVNPDITYVADAYSNNPSDANNPLVFPGTSIVPDFGVVTAADGGAFFGGNIALSPEPGTWLLLGSGLAFMLFGLQRRFANR